MRSSTATILLALSFGLCCPAAPAGAGISAELAKTCRAMMVKAHPTQQFGSTGTAALQRAYFGQCLSRQGRMDEPERSTTGSASTGEPSPDVRMQTGQKARP